MLVENLGGGVFEVTGWAERPGELRQGGVIPGKFICRVQENWTRKGLITVFG